MRSFAFIAGLVLMPGCALVFIRIRLRPNTAVSAVHLTCHVRISAPENTAFWLLPQSRSSQYPRASFSFTSSYPWLGISLLLGHKRC